MPKKIMRQKTNFTASRKKDKVKFLNKQKSISNFLTEEEGRIARKNLAKMGLFIVISSMIAAGAMKAKDVSASCSHANHASHGSHGSHWNSHGSHSAHNSGW